MIDMKKKSKTNLYFSYDLSSLDIPNIGFCIKNVCFTLLSLKIGWFFFGIKVGVSVGDSTYHVLLEIGKKKKI